MPDIENAATENAETVTAVEAQAEDTGAATEAESADEEAGNTEDSGTVA